MTEKNTIPATRHDLDVADDRIDVQHLAENLLGTYAEARRTAREAVTSPDLQRDPTLPMEQHRERVLGQLKLLVERGLVHNAFPSAVGGQDAHGPNVAAFEEFVTGDPSMQIKAGVQWGLFGSAVMHLGTKPHHEAWLPRIMSLEIPGAFAMTEIGHGSDVASIATTATYDPETEEFVIHTPFKAAWKEFLGNAGLHGVAATVFAQLITKGVNHGVHAFYVDIRDPETGEFLPGVGGEDDGLKGGLNGIDNGRLHFDHVRIPRTNLLNRYGDVAPDGTYSSPIASPGRRFFTMLGTLVQGRVSLDGAATAASKLGLQIAVTYGLERRQFKAGDGEGEQVLMDYQRHQRRLIPLIAKTYAMGYAHDELLRKFDDVFSGRNDTEASREDLETLAAGLKALSTWNALDILQECREACGGAGFIAANRLTGLRADLDIYVTFEGDNNVLLQLVAKRLLGDYSRNLKGLDRAGLAQFIATQATDAAMSRSGLRRLVQTVVDTGDERKSAIALRDEDTQRNLLEDRVNSMIAEIAQDLRHAHKLKPAEAAELFNDHQDALIKAAKAHAELLQWEAFTRALPTIGDEGTRRVLTVVRDLFGLDLIQENLGWYLMNGRLSSQRARTLDEYINRLVKKLRPHVKDLVDAFGYTQEHMRAPIATGDEKKRQDEAAAYYRALRASSDAPIDEKVLHARDKARKA
ncbi:acyl-CoA dehydrogenase [Falsarthrobacter nasiphocae]|uniref:acyl-CoA oxidase n=1 Tax=Falsarthrobacter nasiphocae TaxID=189863 RepID=A0AAE3YFD1_9MICC|nr:acyl-CoA dehydrogenase [Falsarthrobacter nasiphocae]MDR6891124.1 acyl-CoA oxidase [Falsarthrobacter nasiphocae]